MKAEVLVPPWYVPYHCHSYAWHIGIAIGHHDLKSKARTEQEWASRVIGTRVHLDLASKHKKVLLMLNQIEQGGGKMASG